MYLAKKIDSNLPIYRSLFKRLASGADLANQEEIKNIIIETKHISDGTKDIFSARNDYYYLVSYLLSNGKEFLRELDENAIDRRTFQKIAEILEYDVHPA